MGNFIINKHHLIKKHQIYCLEKLISREIYNMQLILTEEKSAAQTDFHNPEWKDICVTINTKLLIFQHQLIHNIMYLNEMLHKSRKKVFQLCSFSKFTNNAYSTIFGFTEHEVNYQIIYYL